MAKKEVVSVWQGDMAFATRAASGHEILLDALPKVGGHDRGPRPAEMVLVGLTGCTAMDVISILRKMRVEVDRFEVSAEAETADEHPKMYTHIEVVYRLWGEDVPIAKYQKAVDLSWNKYCSVSNLLKFGTKLTYRAELNGEVVFRGEHETPPHLQQQEG